MNNPIKDLSDLAPDAVNNTIKNLADEPSKFLGHTGKSILSICLDGINYYAERLDYNRKIKLENWKYETFIKLNKIPIENRIDPPLEIAGPLTEASKFYFENETLSSMFSNLLVSSCDSTTLENAHPSFVEIIKQLSPVDAKNLKLFQKNKYLPIGNYNLIKNANGDYETLKTNVFLATNEFNSIDLNAASFSNIKRLGLIEISYTEFVSNDSSYNSLKRSIFFNNISKQYPPDQSGYPKPDIQKGLASITPLGKIFLKACL